MVMQLGVIGLSEGNGHPFSFSAIVNGYNRPAFAASNWPVIYDYLEKRDVADLVFSEAKVTHAWTQDETVTRALCRACKIDHVVKNYRDMVSEVDALLIARDDFECHMEVAKPFLENKIPVYIDKPLTLELSELENFLPYLESGLLMSCSGLRFSEKVDTLKANIADFGKILLVRGTVVNDWEKYGVHMLDILLSVVDSRPVSVQYNTAAKHDSLNIELSDGSIFQVDALGAVKRTFCFDVFGEEQYGRYEIDDNFSAFRRCIKRFVRQVETGKPAIPAVDTVTSIKTLIAGVKSRENGEKVYIHTL